MPQDKPLPFLTVTSRCRIRQALQISFLCDEKTSRKEIICGACPSTASSLLIAQKKAAALQAATSFDQFKIYTFVFVWPQPEPSASLCEL